MAGYIRYEFENEQTLKAQSTEILNKTAIGLGFESARKSINIKIRFKKGASHRSWNSGSLLPSQELAMYLVKGFRAGRKHKRVPKRPVFDLYLQEYSEEIADLCAYAFRTRGTIRQRAKKAGEAIKNDFKRRIYQGSFDLAPNTGKYAKRKWGAGYGDIPLVATKKLFEDLEVVVE
jgi:hypothetical protein